MMKIYYVVAAEAGALTLCQPLILCASNLLPFATKRDVSPSV